MGEENFKIYPERLRDGHIEDISEKYSPAFIGINEKELHFNDRVTVEGQAYLADQNLIFQLHIETCAIMPCRICNDSVSVPLSVKNLYHMVPLNEIKDATFDLSDLLRESILLEVPKFAECQDNNCPDRQIIEKYLKKEPSEISSSTKDEEEQEKYYPFADIDSKG